MKCVPCPYTVGSQQIVYCDSGSINGMRCPYWQNVGQVVPMEEVMTTAMYIDPRIIRFIEFIKDDFEAVGNFRYRCNQWPTIGEKLFVTMLVDGHGNKINIKEIENKYVNVNKEVEVINEREVITQHSCYQ